jgi:hypothetical protein
MSITVNCSIDLTEEELFLVLQHRRHGGVIRYPTLSKALSDEQLMEATADLPSDAPPPPPAPEPEIIPVEPPPLPPKPTRSRAKTNGAEAPINATPLAPPPPPEPLDEPAMRSLLSKVGAVHPLKVKAITNILEAYGGSRRLSECDPSTWPVIAEEAQKVLAEYGA